MSIDWKQIKQEYIDSKGTALLKDLAEKYGVKPATMRSRKNREKWDDEIEGSVATCNATQKKVQRNAGRVATQKAKEKPKKVPERIPNDIDKEIVDKVMENGDLTDEQRLFCIYYVKCFNATKAYQKAYGCSYLTANSTGYKLLSNLVIEEEIKRLKQHRMNRVLLTEDDIFQKMMDIAFADITDYTEFGAEDVPVLHPDTREQLKDENGNPITYKSNYVYFKNSTEIDGSLITEVSQGKDGVKVRLADKMKAMHWLGDRVDLLPTEAREKLSQARERLDIEKAKNSETDKPIEIVIKRKEKTP